MAAKNGVLDHTMSGTDAVELMRHSFAAITNNVDIIFMMATTPEDVERQQENMQKKCRDMIANAAKKRMAAIEHESSGVGPGTPHSAMQFKEIPPDPQTTTESTAMAQSSSSKDVSSHRTNKRARPVDDPVHESRADRRLRTMVKPRPGVEGQSTS